MRFRDAERADRVAMPPYSIGISPYSIVIKSISIDLPRHSTPISPHSIAISPYRIGISPSSIGISPFTNGLGRCRNELSAYRRPPSGGGDLRSHAPGLARSESGAPARARRRSTARPRWCGAKRRRTWETSRREACAAYRDSGEAFADAGPSLEMSTEHRHRPSGSFRQTVMYLPTAVRRVPVESGAVIRFVP
jgi:hypothetical protein